MTSIADGPPALRRAGTAADQHRVSVLAGPAAPCVRADQAVVITASAVNFIQFIQDKLMQKEKVSVKIPCSVTPSESRALQSALQTSGLKSQSKFLRKLMRESLGNYLIDAHGVVDAEAMGQPQPEHALPLVCGSKKARHKGEPGDGGALNLGSSSRYG